MMNAGCYGKTISDNLISCNVISRSGKVNCFKGGNQIFIQEIIN